MMLVILLCQLYRIFESVFRLYLLRFYNNNTKNLTSQDTSCSISYFSILTENLIYYTISYLILRYTEGLSSSNLIQDVH
jgi:hypothetical protein